MIVLLQTAGLATATGPYLSQVGVLSGSHRFKRLGCREFSIALVPIRIRFTQPRRQRMARRFWICSTMSARLWAAELANEIRDERLEHTWHTSHRL